jgi:hypothetical protein
MDVPRYTTERVEYWENSALDSRIYLVELGYPTMPRNPVPDEQSANAIESASNARSDPGTQVT